MVRRPERTALQQPRTVSGASRHRMHPGGLQGLRQRQRRHNAGQAPGKHGLARAGRTDHEDIVPSRRRHLQRPLGQSLVFYVREIRFESLRAGKRLPSRLRRLQALPFSEKIGHFLQASGPVNFQPLYHRSLQGILPRQDHPLEPVRFRPYRQGKRAPDRDQRTVQRKLARHHIPLQPLGGDLLRGRQYAHRYGQVVARPFLPHPRRGQVHHHLLAGQGESRVSEGRQDALLAFPDRVVGQTHQKSLHPGRNVHLHRYGDRFHPHDGARMYLDKHLYYI